MEYAHDPGMLFFRMDDAFLEGITGTSGELTSEAAVGIIDAKGQLCFSSVPEEFSVGKKRQADIAERIAGSGSAGMILEGRECSGRRSVGVPDEASGLAVFSFVPNRC